MKALLPLSGVYGAAVRIRNRLYHSGILPVYHPPVRTISVGNITAGGTGKTPLVEMLADRLAGRGVSLAVVRRKHQPLPGATRRIDDEILQMKHNLAAAAPGRVHIIEAADSKVKAIKRALKAADIRLVLLDDGFQSLYLARDVDIVCVDAADPLGGGHLLPAGRLREHPSALARAHAVVLTRCESVSEAQVKEAHSTVRRFYGGRIWKASTRVSGVASLESLAEAMRHDPPTAVPYRDPATIRNERAFCFCGIGNGRAFIETAHREGYTLVGHRIFADHHPYTASEMKEICREALRAGATFLLTTQKDAARLISLGRNEPTPLPICFLKVETNVEDEAILLDLLLDG